MVTQALVSEASTLMCKCTLVHLRLKVPAVGFIRFNCGDLNALLRVYMYYCEVLIFQVPV